MPFVHRLAAVLSAVVVLAGCGSSAPAAPPPAPPVRAAARPVRAEPPRPAPLAEVTLGPPDAGAVASRALVRPLDPLATPTRGLAGRHVAVWPSHGWYYDASRRAWTWQRAHLFTTIEDVLAFAVVEPYLAPMLERAGAVVLTPRERDTQTHEAVVDADAGATRGAVEETGDWRPGPRGFAHRPPLRDAENPFAGGTSRVAVTSLVPTARTVWTPDLPEAGEYAVTVAYTSAATRATDARYTVTHAGGTTRVAVNQTMGGGTWVRLGTFRFEPGQARVALDNESATPGRTVSADAVRFGGGMGSVERGGATGGRPRWTEAARYYEQFAGFPPYVYHTADETDDYKDDYQSRGEWVNYLRGAPSGPEGHANVPGLGIPVDVALALHTDAGLTTDSTAVGTLAIYHTRGLDGRDTFPDGRPRTLSRTLAGEVQSQIVRDVRALYDPAWSLRPARNRNYSEAARPNVPAVLVELLSHQNLTDVRFALDPRFRFDAARAIYKGIGRFLAGQARVSFVPQPLSVTHLQATFDADGFVDVRWQPRADPIEPSAVAERYVLYTRRGAGGWDTGRSVEGTEARIAPPGPGEVLSVRVAAVNAGGESAPSETLAVGRSGGVEAPPVLVVAGFDRVAAPEIVEAAGRAGVRGDDGVPDGLELSYTGEQVNLDPASVYVDDARPGHGASRGDAAGRPIAGNTHDFAVVHGRALLAAGRSFVSASDEAVESGAVALGDYPTVDLLLGEERTTPAPGWRPVRPPEFEALPRAMRARLATYLDAGGRLLISGAHWAGDAARTPDGAAFLRDVLGVRPLPAGAATSGGADGQVVPAGPGAFAAGPLTYNTVHRSDVYAVEAADGLEPADARSRLALRYARTGAGAGVVRPGSVVALGFPLETLLSDVDRAAVVAAALAALDGE